MAIDTRDKRMSLIGFGQVVPLLMENPDATDDLPGRLMLLYLYSAIAVQALTTTTLDGITQTVGVGAIAIRYEEGLGEQDNISKKTEVSA